ncbi:MAG: hypothetical protein RLZZ312_672 [Bacteroidota bacterium]
MKFHFFADSRTKYLLGFNLTAKVAKVSKLFLLMNIFLNFKFRFKIFLRVTLALAVVAASFFSRLVFWDETRKKDIADDAPERPKNLFFYTLHI